jgi:hypothetical protein
MKLNPRELLPRGIITAVFRNAAAIRVEHENGLSAGNVETNGKAWLYAHGEAAAVNVNGE